RPKLRRLSARCTLFHSFWRELIARFRRLCTRIPANGYPCSPPGRLILPLTLAATWATLGSSYLGARQAILRGSIPTRRAFVEALAVRLSARMSRESSYFAGRRAVR